MLADLVGESNQPCKYDVQNIKKKKGVYASRFAKSESNEIGYKMFAITWLNFD